MLPESCRILIRQPAGPAVNGNVELVKNFRSIGNTFYSGGGRRIFGQELSMPDTLLIYNAQS